MTEPAGILIIEDDPDVLEAMKLVLEKAGHSVRTASSPEEGLAEARAEAPDLIILDVMFGEKAECSGFDCALKLRQEEGLSAVPVLMVTAINARYPGFGFSPESDGEYLPVDDFIEKPVRPGDLIARTGRLLEEKISKWAAWPNRSS